jgi:predicted nicotinamide N-methyase
MQFNYLDFSAGTGLLSVAFSPLMRHYTATDIGPLVPLIQKNVSLNFAGWPKLPSGSPGSNISVEELDWELVQSTTASRRAKLHTPDPVDLLLVVDCIYHPSLIPPLIATINHLTIPQQTTVLIVSELRSDDVMREFLDTWLAQPSWEIWHIGSNLLENQRYVMWVGQKLQSPSASE